MQKHLQELLKDPPHLLKNFHYDDVLAFLQLGEETRFVEGETIIKPDEFVSSAYLITKGKVSVWKENIQLVTLDEKSFLGETFLFSKNNRMAKVSCKEDCILLKYERYQTLNYFRKRPEKLFNIFTKNIIEIQQNKIASMNFQLFALKKQIFDDKQ